MFVPSTAALTHLEGSVYVRFSLLALSSIFFLVDPFAALPTFLAVTEGQDNARRVRTARKASLTAFVILSAFALAGTYIFRLFGITLPAFEIAGGIILLLIGLDMLAAKRSPTQESSGETVGRRHKRRRRHRPHGHSDAGRPGRDHVRDGAGGQAHQSAGYWQMAAIFGAIAVTAAICFLVLGSASRVASALGDTGIRILIRVMGLLLVALAVQYFVNGFVDLGVLSRPSVG